MTKLMNKDLGQKKKIRHIIPISTTITWNIFCYTKKTKQKKKRAKKKDFEGKGGENKRYLWLKISKRIEN